jgi:thiol-disulfide isomerase/thioredoxin
MNRSRSCRGQAHRTGRSLLVVLALLAVTGLLPQSRAWAQAEAPDFAMVSYGTGEQLDATELTLGELLGRGKPLVLNFWAALCPPCRQEMPGFQRVHDELGDEFILVGVDIGPFIGLGSQEQAREFLEEYDIEYLTAYATSAQPVRDYQVRGMPTTFFFASDGTIVAKHTGYLPEEQLREELRALLDREE